MNLGQWLIIRGTLLGSVLVSCLGFMLTAGVKLPPVIIAQELHQPASQAEESKPVMVDAEAKVEHTEPCLVSDKFPSKILKWCEIITKQAEKQKLSADLIAALIWQESGGNPIAYSSSGAVGLMQVMPRDGVAASFQCGSGPCFAKRPTIKELKDPVFNVQYGTKMIAGLIHRYNGDTREALKSYGPMDVGYSYADKVLGIYKQYRKK